MEELVDIVVTGQKPTGMPDVAGDEVPLPEGPGTPSSDSKQAKGKSDSKDNK